MIEGNGFVEVLYFSELLVPIQQTGRKVVQGLRPIQVAWWAKGYCVSIEENGLIEVFYSPELFIPSGEMRCEVGQRLGSIWMP